MIGIACERTKAEMLTKCPRRVLAYAAGYSASQAARIARSDQGVDENPATEPYASYGARRDFHFTTENRRAEMWNDIAAEEGLGVYLHAEQDSFSHAGFGPRFGHLSEGHAPDKTYNDALKADTMSLDTYKALREAGINLGTEAGAVPYAEIFPFIRAFNRAKNGDQKQAQLDLLIAYVDQYRKKKRRKPPGPFNPYYCAPDSATCGQAQR